MAANILRDSDPTGRYGHPKFECAHCKRIFTRFPSVIKHDPPKFCGTECKYESFRANGWPASRGKVKTTCETCGKVEFSTQSIAKTKRFCSQTCMIIWRGPVAREARYIPDAHTVIKCETCGEEFDTHICRIKGGRGRFCSRGCAGSWTIRNKQNRISKAETLFGTQMSGVGLVFESQFLIGSWVVDFFFPSENLVVEYDGEYWHSLPKSKDRDARKDAYLMQKGHSVLRVPERLHIDSPAAAIELVQEALKHIRNSNGNKTN